MDFTKLTAQEVRASEELMRQYIIQYAAVFGKEPNCVTCSFKKDYLKFQKLLKTKTTMKNSKETFKLKKEYHRDIHTYRVNNRPYRVYGHSMSSEFAFSYLKHGKKDELEKRRQMFDVLPGGEVVESKVEAAKKAKKATLKKVEDTSEASKEKTAKDFNLKDLDKHVQEVSDLEVLNTLLSQENEADPRKGAIGIIEERIAEVNAE